MAPNGSGAHALHRLRRRSTAFEEAFPGVFILNAVGSNYTLSSTAAAVNIPLLPGFFGTSSTLPRGQTKG